MGLSILLIPDPENFKRCEIYNGQGVDVILNSLAGKSLLANLEIVSKKQL